VGIILYPILSYWYTVRFVLGELGAVLVLLWAGERQQLEHSTSPVYHGAGNFLKCRSDRVPQEDAVSLGVWVLHGARTAPNSMPLESSAWERMGNYDEGPLVVGTGIHSTV